MSSAAAPPPATVTAKKAVDPKRVFLWWIRLLKVVAVLTLLFNVASYIVTIVAGTKKENGLDNLEKSFLVLAAIGLAIMALALAVAEFEPRWFIEKCYVLHFWSGRGFFIAWMGIQSINNAKTTASALNAVGDKDDKSLVDFMTLFSQIIGWVMIAVGAVYVFMSLLCLRNCLPDDQKDELQVNLTTNAEPAPAGGKTAVVNVESSSSSINANGNASSSSGNSAMIDSMIIANCSVALGMTPDEVRRKFGGKEGRQAAENFARDFAEKKAVPTPNASKTTAPSSTASMSAAPASSSSSVVLKPDPLAEDDFGRRRRGGDDDELERAYYASHTKQ